MNNQDNEKQLDYNGLLMAHYNRLSYISTSNFIDVINPIMEQKYQNPHTAGQSALSWGIKFLFSVVPRDLQDEEFRNEKIDEKLSGVEKNFMLLAKMTNLLYRKGLLIESKMEGQVPNDEKASDNTFPPNIEEWDE